MGEKFPRGSSEWEEARAERRQGREEEIDFDSYPKWPNETNEQYGARLKAMKEKVAKWEEEQAAAEKGPDAADRIREKIEAKIMTGDAEKDEAEGRFYTQEEGEAMIAKMIERAKQQAEAKEEAERGAAEEKRLEEHWQNLANGENGDEFKARVEEVKDFREVVADKIADLVDEATIRKAIETKDYSKIFAVLARLPKAEGIRDFQDRAEYDEELKRRTEEGREKYSDEVIGEALKIVRSRLELGEAALNGAAAEKEGDGEKEKSREQLLEESKLIDMVWAKEKWGIVSREDVTKMSDEDLRKMLAEWEQAQKEEGGEKEKSREQLLEESKLINMVWAKEVRGITSREDVTKMSDEDLKQLLADWEQAQKDGWKLGEKKEEAGSGEVKEGDENKEGEGGKKGGVEYDRSLDLKKREKYEVGEKIDMDGIRTKLAELYARNRRLIRGGENVKDFEAAKAEYSKMLTEKLQVEAREKFNAGQEHINEVIEARMKQLEAEIQIEMMKFIGPDAEKTTKTQEEVDEKLKELKDEAMAKLSAEYEGMQEKLKAEIDEAFMEHYLEETNALEKETIDRLDNGTICRKIVSKVLNNKKLRTAMMVVGLGALAATGLGLATGALAFSYSLTAAGAAAGAAKGVGFGIAGSRQDSRSSEVRGLGVEDVDRVPEEIKNMDILALSADEQNVAKFLMADYSKRNVTDRSKNIKKSLVSSLVGGTVGALASGIHIGTKVDTTTTETVQTGTERVELSPGGQKITGYEDVVVGQIEKPGVMPDLPDVVSGDNINSYINRVFEGKPWTPEMDQWLQSMRGAEYGTTVLNPGSINSADNAGALKLIMEYARQHMQTIYEDVIQRVPQYTDVAPVYGTNPVYGEVAKTSTKFIEKVLLSRLAQYAPPILASIAAGRQKEKVVEEKPPEKEEQSPAGGAEPEGERGEKSREQMLSEVWAIDDNAWMINIGLETRDNLNKMPDGVLKKILEEWGQSKDDYFGAMNRAAVAVEQAKRTADGNGAVAEGEPGGGEQ